MKYKSFNYKNYKKCYFEVFNDTSNSESMCINIIDKNDKVLFNVTVYMPNYIYTPNTATIKNYSENGGMTNFLVKLGVIEFIYCSRRCYPFNDETIDFCQINIDKLKKYSKVFNYEWKISNKR